MVLCHLTNKLIDSFGLYNLPLSVQAPTHKHPREIQGGRGEGAKTVMLTYFNDSVMNPGLLSHFLGLDVPAATCSVLLSRLVLTRLET